MSDTKVQWHPGFVAAMNLELAENRNDLIYEKEYNLNTKPLEIDLLVIKKETNVRITNEIGKLFRGYNIMEYKSPEDHLDIDAFYKAGAYASLYKSYGKTSDERKAEDITVSLVREGKPKGLLQYFKEHNISVVNSQHGIYYVLGGVLFPTQIIVTQELDKENHKWLKALSAKMKKQDMRELLETVSHLPHRFDRELADSVLEISIRANKGIVEELRGDDTMCNALLEIMEPEILAIKREVKAQAEKQGMEKGMEKGIIMGTVTTLRDLDYGDQEIKETIIKKFKLSIQEAESFL